MAKVNILYLTEAHPLHNSPLRWQKTNIVSALPEGKKFGKRAVDESLGWKIAPVETDLDLKELVDGYRLDFVDGKPQLTELAVGDKNHVILEMKHVAAERESEIEQSPTMEEFIKAAAQGKAITIDGKPIVFEELP